MTPDDAQSVIGLFFPQLPPRSLDSVKEIAGLSTGSRPELLTWERVYTLALVRDRAGSTRGAEGSTWRSRQPFQSPDRA